MLIDLESVIQEMDGMTIVKYKYPVHMNSALADDWQIPDFDEESGQEERKLEGDPSSRPYKARVEIALARHCQLIARLQAEKRPFPDRETFERAVVDKLN